jgi:glycosyltransferase involved in cell wall biosynthesis
MFDKSIASQCRGKVSVCLVFPGVRFRVGDSLYIRLNDIIQLIEPAAEEIYVITAHNIAQYFPDKSKLHFVGNIAAKDTRSSFVHTIYNELRAHVQIARGILKLPGSVHAIIWVGRASTIFIPILLARLRRKKSAIMIESKGSELVDQVYKGPLDIPGFILVQVYKTIEKAAFTISDKLIAMFPGLLRQQWLSKYERKVMPYAVSIRFISSNFQIYKPYIQRPLLIGYIGRYSMEKGVLKLAQAVPVICEKNNQVRFSFYGDGPLRSEIEEKLRDYIAGNKVRVGSWIPHDEIPRCLSEMKLLVLPSDYESLAATAMEAMACGTPVVAPPVGAIPDIIIDSHSGFIMEDNSPECIAKDIIRALNTPDLDRISNNAYIEIQKEYSYEVLIEKYRDVLTSL